MPPNSLNKIAFQIKLFLGPMVFIIENYWHLSMKSFNAYVVKRMREMVSTYNTSLWRVAYVFKHVVYHRQLQTRHVWVGAADTAPPSLADRPSHRVKTYFVCLLYSMTKPRRRQHVEYREVVPTLPIFYSVRQLRLGLFMHCVD